MAKRMGGMMKMAKGQKAMPKGAKPMTTMDGKGRLRPMKMGKRGR